MSKEIHFMKKIVYILTLLISSISFAQNTALFDKGNVAYNEGNFQDAITIYESVLNKGIHSSELYFNLANAYYKLNRVAPSIYYYEKAQQLSPHDKDIKNNLSFAKNMTIDAIESVPEIGFSKLFKSVINSFSSDMWAILAVASVLLFVILFLSYYFSYNTNKKRFLFLSSIASLCVMVLTLAFAFQKQAYNQNDNPAIVFAQESDIKAEPNLRSETAFELHEGTKVQIIESYKKTWTKIRLSDGKTGWIATQDIKAL